MPLEHITIGKFIIDNLTTGMYNDPFCIYREYIQNAADAIDKDAFNEKKDVRKDYEIRIKLDPQSSSITIADNGCGVPVTSAAKTLLSLGDSTKTSDRERGFRGIGRLGGVAHCNVLLFTTKAKGETEETCVEWNCLEIQKLLNRYNEHARHLEARDLIAKCTAVKSQKSTKGIGESFFRVDMFGVKSVKGELLDFPSVKSYIEKVAPLPFDISKLHFGKQLDEWLRKEITNYHTYQIFLNDDLLKKKYSRTLPVTKMKGKDRDELIDYAKFDIQDRQEKIIARGWLGIRKDNIGKVLDTSGFNALRVRVGNILIGDEKLLDSCFRQDRFNDHLVGEIHITAPELVPNGRRDNFQDSEMKADFLLGVARIVDPLEKKIQKDSAQKNSLKPIEDAKQTIINVNKQLERGFVGDAAKKETEVRVCDGIQVLTDLQMKRNVSDAIKEKAESVSEKLNTLLDEVKEAKPNIDGALEGTSFSKKERELIRTVLEAMYELYEKSKDCNDLVDRVLKKLNRNNR